MKLRDMFLLKYFAVIVGGLLVIAAPALIALPAVPSAQFLVRDAFATVTILRRFRRLT